MIVYENVILSNFCTYKTGGTAEFFAEPSSTSELINVLCFVKENELNVNVIGQGANILVSDEGVSGLVLGLGKLNRFINVSGDQVYAGCGNSLDELISYCTKSGLKGIEQMSGIPGSVGGAVSMNAGAFGTEVKDVAVYVDTVDENGAFKRINAVDAGFGYRKALGLKGLYITGVMLKLECGDSEELKAVRKNILKKRAEKQPLDFPSCGSVFKRPEGNYAGTLIEQCGLKGYAIGGAEVAEKHANFILNKGGANSRDIYDLIKHVQKTVYEKTGVSLEEEVKFLGF